MYVSVSHWLAAAYGLATLGVIVVVSSQGFDPLPYVDPLIGSDNGGNVFAGATLPYGMAKAVADSASGSNQGGFVYDGTALYGFSMMHDSGTGGNPSLGNFPLFPYTSCPDDDVNNCVYPKKTRIKFSNYSMASVEAKPGHFGLTLGSGIQANMTTTQHAALFKFAFPSYGNDSGYSGKPLLFQDLSDLSDSRQDNASIAVDAESGRITGSGRFNPSFGTGTYVLHFCTDFSQGQIADSGIFVNNRASTDVKEVKVSRSINGYPLPAGAFVRFEAGTGEVYARVATSYVSVEQACAHAEAEIPDFDFERVKEAARDAWRAKLSRVKVSTGGASEDHLRNFYSGMYRTMVNPQNYTGENPLWSSGEPYFDSFYCIWDLFRSQMPFLTILDPAAVAEMVRSLIDTYRHVGWLPDCRMSLCKGYTQGGSNADNVLADVFLKGIRDGIDWDDGFAAVRKDAEVEPYDWSNEGRGGLDSWKKLGYIPVQDFDYKGFGTMTRSVSRTLEYAYNDFCISQMADKLLGNDTASEKEKYLERSGNWKNLFKADTAQSIGGYTGFFQPRFLNETWAYQDPLKCSNIDYSDSACSLQSTGPETFESSLWEYGFFVPHDQASLISLYGGPSAFVQRLDYLHDNNITYIGNEPAFLTVFQYHYAGRPGLSAKRAHYYIPRFFSPTPAGLPGNDDSGAMGSFLAFAMMGLFPNPGQDVYLITPPFFESVEIVHPPTGNIAKVRTVVPIEGPAASNSSGGGGGGYYYIQSATLDGEAYTKNWLDHSFFIEGKELVLVLGAEESTEWGTRVQDLPPSLGEYKGFSTGGNGTGGYHYYGNATGGQR